MLSRTIVSSLAEQQYRFSQLNHELGRGILYPHGSGVLSKPVLGKSTYAFQVPEDNVKRIILTLLCVCLSCVGCEDQGTDDFDMTYLQGPCHGSCPAFSIHVYSDRSLQYVAIDTIWDRVTNQQIHDLADAFEQCDYFSLKDQYVAVGATDFASAVTSFRFGGRYKSVRHYFGDPSAPEELRHLYSRIDDILNTKQWVGHPVILEFI